MSVPNEFEGSKNAITKLSDAFAILQETRQNGYWLESEYLDLVHLCGKFIYEIGGIPTIMQYDEQDKIDALIYQASRKFSKVDAIRQKEDGDEPRREYIRERKLTPDEILHVQKLYDDPNQFFDLSGFAEKYQVKTWEIQRAVFFRKKPEPVIEQPKKFGWVLSGGGLRWAEIA